MQRSNPQSFQFPAWVPLAIGVVIAVASSTLLGLYGILGAGILVGALCGILGLVVIFHQPFLGALGLAIIFPMLELEFRGLPLPKMYALMIVSLIALRCLVFDAKERDNVMFRLPLLLPFSAVILAGVLSTWNSIDPFVTLFRVLMQPVMMYVAVVAVYNSVTTRKQVVTLIAVMIGLGFISALIGWYNYFSGNFQAISSNFPRVTPPMYLGGTHLSLASLLVMLMPITLALGLIAPSRWLSWLLLGGVGLFAVTTMFTLSRAGWICLAIQAPIWMWMLRRRPILLSVLVFTGLVGVVIAIPAMMNLLNSFVRESSDTARDYLSELALTLFWQHPFVGAGFGTFTSYNFRVFDSTFFPPQPLDAHGTHYKVLSETGLVGLLAVGWLLAALSLRLWSAFKRAGDDRRWRTIIFGLGVAFVISTIFELSSTRFYALQYWIPVSVALTAARLSYKPVGTQPHQGTEPT